MSGTNSAKLRIGSLILLGILWFASAGILIQKEILPALVIRPPNFYERLVQALSPYEDLCYGLYHKDSLIGGLRLYYEVVSSEEGSMAILRPTFWCYPLHVEGRITVTTAYQMESAHWNFQWRDIKGFMTCRPSGDYLDWKGKVGDRELSLRVPREISQWGSAALPPLRVRKSKMPGGCQKLVVELGSVNFQVTALVDPSGMIQRADLPAGIYLKRVVGKEIGDTYQGAHAQFPWALMEQGQNLMQLVQMLLEEMK